MRLHNVVTGNINTEAIFTMESNTTLVPSLVVTEYMKVAILSSPISFRFHNTYFPLTAVPIGISLQDRHLLGRQRYRLLYTSQGSSKSRNQIDVG